MRLVMISALVPLCASFASIPKPDQKAYEPPEGQHLIRTHYQFEGVQYPITGLAPNSGGPHKLIVVLAGTEESHDKAFLFRASVLEKAVAAQGHGMVLVEYPDFESYPDFGDAAVAEFGVGNLTGSRGLMCAEWERKGHGVIAGINHVCGRDDFDCSSGIALAGYSQGSGLVVQTSKLLTTPPVNALLTTAWAPLLFAGNAGQEDDTGAGYLLPPDALALHWCGFDDSPTNPPAWSTSVPSVPADEYPPALSTFVNKTKRLSLISAQDFFGNPTQDPAATAPVFSLQRDFSGYDCPDSQNDCTQNDGSGYYVVPAGNIFMEGMSTHDAFIWAFLADDFIGEKWHADAAFTWLGNAAFGA